MLKNTFTKNSEIDWMFDLDLLSDTAERAYLKRMAINTVLDYVGRTMSTAQFRFKQDKKTLSKEWDYILNVRPNKSNSAGDFWHKFVYKLLMDNEILIVLSDDNQLLIADDYVKTTYAIYEDSFSEVIVNDYEFKRSFKMNEVIYLQYNNDKLNKITDGLFKDYGELFGRMMEVSMRNNQIRAGVSVDSAPTANNEKDKTQRLQNFINKIYKSFKTSSVALVPKMKGFEYEEFTNKVGATNISTDELTKMEKSLVNKVAEAIGLPPALLHGEMADLESNEKAYRKNCINPLIKKLQDELNAKLLTKNEYNQGIRVKISGVLVPDILEFATQIDKVGSSGVFWIDEIREKAGFDPLPNGEGQKVIMTKNYENVKGGEESETQD